jgi:hypothetical protein
MLNRLTDDAALLWERTLGFDLEDGEMLTNWCKTYGERWHIETEDGHSTLCGKDVSEGYTKTDRRQTDQGEMVPACKRCLKAWEKAKAKA